MTSVKDNAATAEVMLKEQEKIVSLIFFSSFTREKAYDSLNPLD